jgi:mannitol/fructose-specific phosphotransferase system IIA component (Ntr-type)
MRELQTMTIVDELSVDRIRIGVGGSTKPEILRELLGVLNEKGLLEDLDRALQEFLEREGKGSTGIGNGIAIPHVRSEQAKKLEYVVATSKEGVDFESLDGDPIHIIVLMMAPKDSHGIHIKALARVSRILNDESVRVRLANADTPETVLRLIAEREEEIG